MTTLPFPAPQIKHIDKRAPSLIPRTSSFLLHFNSEEVLLLEYPCQNGSDPWQASLVETLAKHSVLSRSPQ